MDERVILGPGCVAEGAAWLVREDPRFAPVFDAIPVLPLRLRPEGFAELLRAIVSQQVSVASALATWTKVEAAGLTTPEAVLAAQDEELQAVGFSRPKLRYARALAEEGIDYDALRAAPSEDVIARLIAVKGIGRWTAEIYAMFSLGRADVFAAGDLAMQEAARMLFDLPARPSEAALRTMAEPWSPWRSVAARALWSYYERVKSREGVV